MEPKFKGLTQIGVIVRNLEDALKHYESMGIGPWDVSAMDNTVLPFTDLKFNGMELETKGVILKTAFITCYGLEIELIEPVAPETPHYKWLQEHGPGIHHVAFDIDGEYKDFLASTKELTGKDPWIRGVGIGGLMDFAYVDLRKEMGLIVECYREMQKGKAILKYDKELELTE